jgi:hypothetical protein
MAEALCMVFENGDYFGICDRDGIRVESVVDLERRVRVTKIG